MHPITAAAPLSRTDMRDAFINVLYDIARADRSVVMLSNDFGAPGLDRFRAEMPEQFINAAISEQNMISTAAGMAMAGRKVVVYSIAGFLTLRALEQVKIDLCVMKTPVLLLGVGSGYAYSVDGPTHHATEDIAVMRSLANLTLFSPSEPAQAAALAPLITDLRGPHYLRLDRGRWPILGESDPALGVRSVRAEGELALVATGIMVHRALEVAALLAGQGISARVIDLFRLKPVPVEALTGLLDGVTAVATLEEHGFCGGLGGLIAETIADAELGLPLKRFGIPDDQLYAYGDRARLHAARGLDAASVAATLLDWLAGRKGGR